MTKFMTNVGALFLWGPWAAAHVAPAHA